MSKYKPYEMFFVFSILEKAMFGLSYYKARHYVFKVIRLFVNQSRMLSSCNNFLFWIYRIFKENIRQINQDIKAMREGKKIIIIIYCDK